METYVMLENNGLKFYFNHFSFILVSLSVNYLDMSLIQDQNSNIHLQSIKT